MTSEVLSNLFIESFVRGVGKTSGALVTAFVGWQMFKISYGQGDFVTFMLGKKPKKRQSIDLQLNEMIEETSLESSELDHEEVNLEDMEHHKFKKLFENF